MPKIQVTLEFTLDELPDEERREAAFDDQLPSVEEVESYEFADMVRWWMQDSGAEFWAGSDLYAQITNVDVLKHEMVNA